MRRLALLAILCVGAHASTAEPDTPAAAGGEHHFNLPTPTWGGKQLWTDELIYYAWRIQRHAYTGHCRLLDDQDQRRAWGEFEACRRELEEYQRERSLAPMKGKVVIALHGVLRTRGAMAGLCAFLEHAGGYTVLNMSYASTRNDLTSHALALGRVIQNLGGDVTEINFVAHSLGNLVIRRYLGECYAGRSGLAPDSRIRRIVMLAPPNQGSTFAVWFKNNAVMEMVWGDSIRQLSEHWEEIRPDLAVPRCEFGILAGGLGNPGGRNRWLDGDDDLVVSVEETKLGGARDFATIPRYHGKIMDDPTAQRYVLSFLQNGFFISPSQRHPLPP
jgi:hypothetical protein